MSANALFAHHDESLNYHFHDDHPFHPTRLKLTIDLLKELGALDSSNMLAARQATEEELLRVHSSSYIEEVKGLSCNPPEERYLQQAEKFGFAGEDTPYFSNMHHIASCVVGGSITAVEAVMTGKSPHALHLGGGLHHALSAQAAGFCVYNDVSVAIAHLRHHYDAKVLYIDTDAHHGDGVQWAFYTDSEVCTYSIHETGKYLFPGTGFVNERGQDTGYGACVNIPLQPYTEDESWLHCFKESIQRLTAYFKPDVIVSQHGCDAHALDPLSHLHCSMQIYNEIPAIIHELAHKYCNGKWVAFGGGGYDIWRVVPRAWSLVWLEMSDHPLKETIKLDPLSPLPAAWIDRWQQKAPVPLPAFWLDDLNSWQVIPRRDDITRQNNHSLQIALQEFPAIS
ncbi:acetoin utilization protein AcuC [Paenibacillus sediminis]|uniref:Acetoin utilization protein AcuC n=1 Tax=Paenibacillus sediminis TaxID=664909 RepID=A0ABS4GZ39_9BACL|nr:acetoin utilization protein AcuC [Paenibacillus sediminis]MBP1935537.1 acetoin utilization protein AcuC [Paenibacillus sediminis]